MPTRSEIIVLSNKTFLEHPQRAGTKSRVVFINLSLAQKNLDALEPGELDSLPGRDFVINRALQEFSTEPDLTRLTEHIPFVESELRGVGMAPLTQHEKDTIVPV